MAFPESLCTGSIIQQYLPYLAWLVGKMEKSSLLVDVWCVIEGLFYILLKLHIQWLQLKDPLEASLSAAPMMSLKERAQLWNNICRDKETNLVEFISGWFFDVPLENISRYDVRDFLCWSLFEGRNQEHLTGDELEQRESFLEELEDRLSYHVYGQEEQQQQVVVIEEEQDKENDLDVAKKLTFDDDDEKPRRRPKKGKTLLQNRTTNICYTSTTTLH